MRTLSKDEVQTKHRRGKRVWQQLLGHLEGNQVCIMKARITVIHKGDYPRL